MATKAKINLKFVLILIVVAGTVMVALGGMWYLYNRTNGGRNYAKGEELLKKGDVDGAFNQFGRAVKKEPSNQKFILKMEEVLLTMRPTSRDQARELYGNQIGLLNHEVNARSADPEVHLKRMSQIVDCAKFIDLAEVWEQVRDAAGDIERRLSTSEPKRVYARLYRGMANLRLRHLQTADELQQAVDDLNAFIAAYPDSDLGWGTLLGSQIMLYGDMRRAGENRRADEKLAEIDQLLAQAMHAVPDGADVARAWFIRRSMDSSPEVLQAAGERLVELTSKSSDLLLVADVASVLNRMRGKAYAQLARTLLEPFVQADPERLVLRLMLAQTNFAMDELEAAEKEATAIMAAGPLPVGYLSRFQFDIQAQAASLLVDAAYRRWEMADALAKPGLLPAIKTARDNLAAKVSVQDGAALRYRGEGKLAFAQGDYSTAAAKFEEILKFPGADQDYEILTFAGLSLQRLGVPGAALDRIKAASELEPRNVGIMVIRAALEADTRQLDDARRTVEAILRLDKTNKAALQIQTQIERDTKLLSTQPNPLDKDPKAETVMQAGVAEVRGDLEGARRILVDAHKKDPAYLSYIVALIGLEANAGNYDLARGYLEEIRKIAPDHPIISKLEFELTYTDPIEKVERSIDMAVTSEADRAAYKYVSMLDIAASQEASAQKLASSGDAAGAEKATGVMQRARARAAQLLSSSSSLNDHPTVIEAAFNAALKKHDWAEVERLVVRATAVDADQCSGLLFKGRMEIERGQNDQAVHTLLEARDLRSFSSTPWRLLGVAYYRTGNLAECLHALEESYHRNPNDMQTVRLYVPLLRQAGDNTRALLVLREARAVARNEPDIIHEWLTVEALAGDLNVALRERQDMYRRNPANRDNAVALATLLAENDPKPEHILDASGRSRYDATEWGNLPLPDRERQLEDVRARWLAESSRMIDALETAGETGFDIAQLRAKLLRAQGKAADGETVLSDFIKKQDPATRNVGMYLALAEYQRVNAQYAAARDTLENFARSYQDPKQREADRVLGDLYFSRGQFEKALESYNRVLEPGFDHQISLRAVEAMLNMKRFDEAARRLEQIVASEGSDALTYLLDAAIHQARAEALFTDGKSQEGEQESAAMARSLNQAQQSAPASPLPFLARARYSIESFRRTRDAGLITVTMQALEEAKRLGADAGQVSSMRVDALMAQGDAPGAIGELRRLIEQQPENIMARRNLVQLLIAAKSFAGAIDAVQNAIAFNPTNSNWYADLGDLLVHEGKFPAAIEAYRKSYQLKPDRTTLIKACGAMLQMKPTDYDTIIQLVKARKGDLDDPFVRGIYARALQGKGQDQDALQELRNAYQLHRKAIQEGADPDTIFPWFVALRQIISLEQRERVERFVMEVCGEKPDSHELHQLSLVWAQESPGKPDYRRAVELERLAIERCSPEDANLKASLNFYLGNYYIVLKDYANAAAAYEQTVAVDTKNDVALNDLAYILATELNNPAKALPFARKAAELKSADPSVLDTLGVVLIGVKQCEEAENVLRKAQTLKATAPVCLHLAQALICLEKPDKARTYLDRALQLPSDEPTKAQINRLLDDIKKR